MDAIDFVVFKIRLALLRALSDGYVQANQFTTEALEQASGQICYDIDVAEENGNRVELDKLEDIKECIDGVLSTRKRQRDLF
jgi:hypothetical protein